jgi:hypothetical protein
MFSSRGPTRGVWVDPTTKIAWPDDALKPDLVAPGNKVLGASATKADAASPTKNTLATLFRRSNPPYPHRPPTASA